MDNIGFVFFKNIFEKSLYFWLEMKVGNSKQMHFNF